jgi:hypothetical protein
MRTATTDEHARRWFRRYWTFGVGSSAHILVASLLEAARRAAEGNADEVTAPHDAGPDTCAAPCLAVLRPSEYRMPKSRSNRWQRQAAARRRRSSATT